MTEHVLARVPTYRADLGFRSSPSPSSLSATPVPVARLSIAPGVRPRFLTVYYRRQVNPNRAEGFSAGRD